MISIIVAFLVGVVCGVGGHKWLAAKANSVAPAVVAEAENVAKKL